MNPPDTLHFGIGGFESLCWNVELKADALHVRSWRAGNESGSETVLTPSPEAWSKFWQAVDAANVWRWKADYTDNDVLDGTQWGLELAHAGRRVSCEGSNAYPDHNAPGYDESPSFTQLLSALRTLTGVKAIG